MTRRKDAAFKKDLVFDEYDTEEGTYDASFVLDPAKLFDELPQPFRLIDKTVNYVFDKAWEAIQELESRANVLGLGGKLPVFDSAEELPDFSPATLMCPSVDGKLVFLVAKNGIIYALLSETSSMVAFNDELQGMKMETLCAGHLDEDKHFVCALMENGTAAIFALSGSNLHLLRVFNDEFGTKGSLTNYINVSFDGNYLAVGWKIPLKSSWLEIYKMPKEFWCNEMALVEEKLAQKIDEEANVKEEENQAKDESNLVEKDSSDSENESINSRPTSLNQSAAQTGYLNETSFTKPTLLLKIKAPIELVPNPANNVTSALKNIDQDYDVIGTGTNHVLLQSYFDESDKAFKRRHQQHLQYLVETEEADNSNRLPEVHFLTPGRFVPAGILNSSDQVNSILVRWSEDSHVLVYSLVKSTKDIERKADVVLTTSSTILVSCVSFDQSFFSLGTQKNNIITWNKLTGLSLGMVWLSSNSTITGLHFTPNITEDNNMTSFPKLLACCEDGGLYVVEYGDHGKSTITSLPSSSFKMEDRVVQVTCLSNLPQLLLIQRESGKIMLLDVQKKILKCQIALFKPITLLKGFCYAYSTSTLYIKGGRKDEYNEDILPESVCVYKMNVDTLPVVKTCLKRSSEVKTTGTLGGFDERIKLMENQRNSSYEKRQRNYKTRWRQLESELNHIKRPTTLGASIWFIGNLEF